MALGVKQKHLLKDKSYISQILRISVNKLVCYIKLLTEWSVFQSWRALTQVLNAALEKSTGGLWCQNLPLPFSQSINHATMKCEKIVKITVIIVT